MGGVLVHKGTPITLTFMVYDPEDRARDYFPGDLFKTGVNVSVSGTWSGKLAGRASSIGLTSAYSTKRGADLSTVPAAPGLTTGSRKGSYNVSLQLTRRLMESARVEGKGLDMVFKMATADGNPNLIQSSLIVGLAGHGMVRGRPSDSFGVGAFYYNLSNALQESLRPLVRFNDEQGVETWYSFAVTPWFKLTGSLQWVNPAAGDRDHALLGGLRANLAF